ncbi:MAG: lipopolysaccharide biosynthesis protein [Proteobacteria bacterium]|nr:lipopolysaccharide biosynthesis protein [Pseudomonadota bacterium]
MTLITVRLLQPHDYGVVATAGLFTVFANLLLDGGLSLLLVSERNLSDRQLGAAFSWVLIAACLLGGVIVATAPLAALFFKTPDLARVLQVSALQLPLWALLVVPQALLTRTMHFREMALAQFVASVVQGGVTLLMAFVGAAYWALVTGILVGACVRTALQWRAVRAPPRPNLDFSGLRPLLSKGSHLLGQRVVYFFTGDFDTLVLGRLAGPTALGSYSLAKTLAHTALDQLSGVVNQVSVPVFAGKHEVSEQVAGLVQLITLVALLVFPLFWIAGVISQVAFPLLFGARWEKLIVPFMAFSFVLPFRSIYTLLDSAIVGTGRVSTTFKNMLTWAAVMIPLLLISARYGSNAAACSWIVGFPVVFWFSMRRIGTVFSTGFRKLVSPMLAPVCITAAACALGEGVILSGPRQPSQFAQMAQVAAAGSVSVGSYWLLTRWLTPGPYLQAQRVLLRLVGR